MKYTPCIREVKIEIHTLYQKPENGRSCTQKGHLFLKIVRHVFW